MRNRLAGADFDFTQARPASWVDQTPASVTIQPVESSRKKSDRQASLTGDSVQLVPPSLVKMTSG